MSKLFSDISLASLPRLKILSKCSAQATVEAFIHYFRLHFPTDPDSLRAGHLSSSKKASDAIFLLSGVVVWYEKSRNDFRCSGGCAEGPRSERACDIRDYVFGIQTSLSLIYSRDPMSLEQWVEWAFAECTFPLAYGAYDDFFRFPETEPDNFAPRNFSHVISAPKPSHCPALNNVSFCSSDSNCTCDNNTKTACRFCNQTFLETDSSANRNDSTWAAEVTLQEEIFPCSDQEKWLAAKTAHDLEKYVSEICNPVVEFSPQPRSSSPDQYQEKAKSTHKAQPGEQKVQDSQLAPLSSAQSPGSLTLNNTEVKSVPVLVYPVHEPKVTPTEKEACPVAFEVSSLVNIFSKRFGLTPREYLEMILDPQDNRTIVLLPPRDHSPKFLPPDASYCQVVNSAIKVFYYLNLLFLNYAVHQNDSKCSDGCQTKSCAVPECESNVLKQKILRKFRSFSSDLESSDGLSLLGWAKAAFCLFDEEGFELVLDQSNLRL